MNKFILAQVIKNPALGTSPYGQGGNAASGQNIAMLLATFIRVMVVLAGVGFILYFVLGAFEWITAGGDKGKLDSAKHYIINALTGLAIMLALFAVTVFLKEIFGFDVLNIVWPTPQ